MKDVPSWHPDADRTYKTVMIAVPYGTKVVVKRFGEATMGSVFDTVIVSGAASSEQDKEWLSTSAQTRIRPGGLYVELE